MADENVDEDRAFGFLIIKKKTKKKLLYFLGF